MFELISAILLLIPGTVTIGALLALGTMSGAIMGHLTKLGIEFNNDGGSLFMMAVLAFVSSLIVLLIHRRQIPIIGERLFSSPNLIERCCNELQA